MKGDCVRFARHFLLATILLAGGIGSALLGHAGFVLAQRCGILGSHYLDHPHAALPVALFTVLAGFFSAMAVAAAHLVDGGNRCRVLAASRAFASTSRYSYAIGGIAVVSLAAIEGCEHSLAGAFGSVPMLGIALVAAIGFAVGQVLRALASWIAGATELLAVIVALFIGRGWPVVPLRSETCGTEPPRAASMVALCRIRGNRAPPLVLA